MRETFAGAIIEEATRRSSGGRDSVTTYDGRGSAPAQVGDTGMIDNPDTGARLFMILISAIEGADEIGG